MPLPAQYAPAFVELLNVEWSWGRALTGLALIAGVLTIAFLVDLAIGRFTDRVRAGHGPWRPSVLRAAPALRLLLLAVGALTIMLVAFGIHPVVLVSVLVGAVLALGLASVDVVKNVIAGAVIGARKPFRVGDRVAAGDFEGEVLHTGLRSTILLTRDGERLAVPNQNFVTEVSVRVCIPDAGAPVRIELPVPAEMDLTAARNLAFRAACISKYASARKRPEVHLAPPSDASDRVTLQVRAYAFDGRFSDHLRSEVIEIMAEGMRTARPPAPAPAARA